MPKTQSPFMQTSTRLSFGMDWMLLVMLVAATTAMLVGYSLFLPSVTGEINAWLGRTVDMGETEDNRRSQVIFLMICYSAPMALGLVARLLQLGARKVARQLEARSPDDEEFRME